MNYAELHARALGRASHSTWLYRTSGIAYIAGVLQTGSGATSAHRSAAADRRRRRPAFHHLIGSRRSLVSRHGRDALLADGDFALTDRTHHYQLASDGDVSQTVLMIPRDLLLLRIGPVERFTSIGVDGRKGFGDAFTRAQTFCGNAESWLLDIQIGKQHRCRPGHASLRDRDPGSVTTVVCYKGKPSATVACKTTAIVMGMGPGVRRDDSAVCGLTSPPRSGCRMSSTARSAARQ